MRGNDTSEPGEAPAATTPSWSFALRWLAHPISLVSLVVLVVNDHVLKAALGTWWTGKLSDAAGMVFFPALLAVVIGAALARLSPRALMTTAIATTAAGFT